MIIFNSIFEKSKKYFTHISVKYKDESLFMKILGLILFFNTDFKNKFTTTIGHTIYFPNKIAVENNEITYSQVLLHELIHIYDHNFLFSFLYLCPQILVLLSIPLAFIGWKLSLICLIFLLPLPAYFRMNYEKRAYIISLYAIKKFADKNLLSITEDYMVKVARNISKNFTGSAYYFMWPFSNIENDLTDCAKQIFNNKKPILDIKIYDMIDDIMNF